ncbi:unnamed protein product [Closterium sp. NIES-53]
MPPEVPAGLVASSPRSCKWRWCSDSHLRNHGLTRGGSSGRNDRSRSEHDAEDSKAGDDGGEQSGTKESTDSDVVELTYQVCLPSAAFTTLYNDAKDDADLPELDPDMHAYPANCWDIATMMVKEAFASWKGKAVMAAMDEDIRSLVAKSTWVLVERPPGVNMKNRWVLMTKYHIDDTVEHEKARLVVKGFTQVLYMYQPDYYNDRIGRVGDNGTTYWVLVYVDDLLGASSSTAMLKELLEAAFDLREISPLVKYLGLEIVRYRSARKLWLHQQDYADKLRRRFIDKEQGGRVPKTLVSVDANAELTFDDEEAQECEEEYRQKVGLLQFAATTTRPDIAFACSKLGSGLTVRSDQQAAGRLPNEGVSLSGLQPVLRRNLPSAPGQRRRW